MTQGYVQCQDCDSPLYRTDEFRMFCFKVLPCSKRYCHDWTVCPFAHPGEKAKRRDPRVYTYTGIACTEMKKNLQCPRGDSCPYAHNVFEYWLHPSRYRTQLCNDGVSCNRKVCFFAHTVEELRLPSCKALACAEAAPKAGRASFADLPDEQMLQGCGLQPGQLGAAFGNGLHPDALSLLSGDALHHMAAQPAVSNAALQYGQGPSTSVPAAYAQQSDALAQELAKSFLQMDLNRSNIGQMTPEAAAWRQLLVNLLVQDGGVGQAEAAASLGNSTMLHAAQGALMNQEQQAKQLWRHPANALNAEVAAAAGGRQQQQYEHKNAAPPATMFGPVGYMRNGKETPPPQQMWSQHIPQPPFQNAASFGLPFFPSSDNKTKPFRSIEDDHYGVFPAGMYDRVLNPDLEYNLSTIS